MQATSELWKQLWQSETAVLESKAIINGVEYANISPPVITRAAMLEGASIGNVVSATCQFTLETDAVIPKSAEVKIQKRLTNGDEENPIVSEWLNSGTFYISRRNRDPVTGVWSFECYDALLKTNAVFTDVPWTTETGEVMTTETGEWIYFSPSFPCSMDTMVDDISTLIGVELDPRTTIATGDIYTINSMDAGATIRDVLSGIGAANCGNWIITPDNKLRLVPLASAVDAQDAEDDVVDVEIVLASIDVNDTIEITGVRYTDGEAMPVLIGDETGVVLEVSMSYGLAQAVANQLIGTIYQPFTLANAIYDPAAEIGDFVRYDDDVASVINSEIATLGAGFTGTLASPIAAEMTDEFPYIGASERTLTQAKAYTVETVEKAVSDFNESLSQEDIFNRLTDNGAAQGIYMLDGQLYVNMSYARSGILILGGLNNVSGQAEVYDADGNMAASVDNNGFTSYTEDQQIKSVLSTGGFSILRKGTDPSTGQSVWNSIMQLALYISSGNYYGSLHTSGGMAISSDDYLRIANTSAPQTPKCYIIMDGSTMTLQAGLSQIVLGTGLNGSVVTLGNTLAASNLESENGATGTFTTADGKTVTVYKGIITGIA